MVNVHKSKNSPPSLLLEKAKQSGTYRTPEVIDILNKDFRGKCYICEDNELTSINVEHFTPHKGDRDLMFAWSNLFLCCSHCNNSKLSIPIFNNILDCTDVNINVLDKIKLKVDPWPFGSVSVTVFDQDVRTNNTMQLLDRVYNGRHTSLKLLEGDNLRNKIIRELREFYDLLFNYFDPTSSAAHKAKAMENIERKLNLNSPFIAFKVWIIRETPQLLNEFKTLIPSHQEIYNLLPITSN